ncbi:MAG: DUF5667 domain-containing protein [Dehalococcoidia bacterium]
MKKIAAIVVTVVAISVTGGTVYAAQDSLPGEALYPVKVGVERATMMLAGNDLARAERALDFAGKRVREIIALTERGRKGDLELAAERYCYAMNISLAVMERVRNRGVDTESVTGRAAKATARHLAILDGLYEMVPDEAKPAIARAMEQSLQCYQRAIQVREQLRLQVSELPTVPTEVQERVQQQVREHAQAGQGGPRK